MYNVQDYSVLYNNMFVPLYVRVCILLTCGKHLRDHIISLRGEVCAHRANFSLPLLLRCLHQDSKVSGHVFVY
jgi:hypothetical protein